MESKMIYKISKYVLIWTIIALLLCIMTGCAKQTDALNDAATVAHQTIADIGYSLPKECKTEAVNKRLETADSAVDSVVSACESQKATIDQERIRWKWSFFALAIIILFHVGRKVIK